MWREIPCAGWVIDSGARQQRHGSSTVAAEEAAAAFVVWLDEEAGGVGRKRARVIPEFGAGLRVSATGRIPGCAGPAAAHPVSAAGKAPLAPGPRCHVLGSPGAPQGSRWLRRRQLRRQLRRRAFLPAASSRSAVLSVRPRTIARGGGRGVVVTVASAENTGRPVPCPAAGGMAARGTVEQPVTQRARGVGRRGEAAQPHGEGGRRGRVRISVAVTG